MKNLLEFIGDYFTENFLSAGGYFYWGWTLVYVVVGFAIAYGNARRLKKTFGVKDGLAVCFPRPAFWGKSAWRDYQLFFISNGLILSTIAFFFMERRNDLLFSLAGRVERSIASTNWNLGVSHGLGIDMLYTAGLLFVADLGWTVQHILFHRVPWFWEFHKVHHSATELNLFTVTRLHPFEVVMQACATGLCMGVFIGLCKATLGYTPGVVSILNVSAAMVLFRLTGIYRHSPIWIPFPRSVSYFFCSPAMHHVHHSVDRRHHDKNFSNVFSFWDLIFGTLYIPKSREHLQFGIPRSRRPYRNYDTLAMNLLYPFLPNWLLEKIHRPRRKNA